MSYSDDYDNASDLADAPFLGSSSATASNDRNIRRRSSKACDQCRKSKCKCERSGPNEPCKSCIMLGTSCTFLGPSRKRGPPKGYIDAIEARLHQTEALLGIVLATKDPRAKSLIRDISQDSLAKQIISRVDNSPYGVKGRKRDDSNGPHSKQRPHQETHDGKVDLTSTHPSNEWQDRVSSMLDAAATAASSSPTTDTFPSLNSSASHPNLSNGRPSLRVIPHTGVSPASDDSPGRRQRRRVDTEYNFTPTYAYSNGSAPGSAVSLHRAYAPHSPLQSGFFASGHMDRRGRGLARNQRTLLDIDRSPSPTESGNEGSGEELAGAVGQLSLNEDEQVRYHGTASGLHLLGVKERVDGRNEGGIWRFPKARVWPPLPSGTLAMNGEDEFASELPDLAVQEHLLELYFAYVHPSFPVIHKRTFFEAYRSKPDLSPDSPESDAVSRSSGSPFPRRKHRVPTILLFAMYALASRYDAPYSPADPNSNSNPPPPPDGAMWAAGDEHLDRAKIILDSTYASSRPATCQALLLMGYREIGIGAMAQAWTYIGMAIRMAQDLGMHRCADGWARANLGGRLFGEWELLERRRIWYACVIMDKYVSTYIGRPLMIFERDFDTLMPSEEESEELEEWAPHPSHHLPRGRFRPIPGHVISCFNATATLSGILSLIVQAIYAVRPICSRHTEASHLEGILDKWFLELPEHLRFEPGLLGHGKAKPLPTPHVLTLHMQYWCAVLLLHRPFIRHLESPKHKQSEDSDEGEGRALAEKSYELCAGAANHISTIVMTYSEHYSLSHSSVFLCYYVFTASVMHVTSLSLHPTDPQARMGLSKCMDALKSMETVWPSAGRALELLRGANFSLADGEFAVLVSKKQLPNRHKRSAEHLIDCEREERERDQHALATGIHDYIPLRPPNGLGANGQGGYAQPDVYTDDGYLSQTGPAQSVVAAPTQGMGGFRWPGGDLNFNGPLSTSVLPQFSIGLVDGRVSVGGLGNSGAGGAGGAGGRMQPHADVQAPAQSGRYPQYWNDYSSFPQLGSAGYGGLTGPTSMGSQQAQTSAVAAAAQIYIPEQQYSIYSQLDNSSFAS